MMNRRGFLGAILAAGVAPSIAKAGVLMPIRSLWTPPGSVCVFPNHLELGSATFAEIVATTLRTHGADAIRTITTTNRLLANLRPAIAGDERRIVGVWDGQQIVTKGIVSVRTSHA